MTIIYIYIHKKDKFRNEKRRKLLKKSLKPTERFFVIFYKPNIYCAEKRQRIAFKREEKKNEINTIAALLNLNKKLYIRSSF